MTNLFMSVLDMTLKGSFVILTVCIIRWWLKLFDYPRRFSYLLWGIVLLRLLLPVSIASPLSRLPDRFTDSIAAQWADDYVGDTRFIHDELLVVRGGEALVQLHTALGDFHGFFLQAEEARDEDHHYHHHACKCS